MGEKGNEITLFVNHLEFLGYDCLKQKSDKFGDFFICQNASKIDFLLFRLVEFKALILRCRWAPESNNIESNKYEVLRFTNDFNSSNIFSCCYLDEDNEVIIQSVLQDTYSKTLFGANIDIFANNVDEAVGGIRKICEDNYDSDSDDVPFGENGEPDLQDDDCNWGECDNSDDDVEDCCWDGCDEPTCEDYDYMSEDGPSNSPCYHNDDFS